MIFLTHPEPAISHGAGSGTENKDDHGINVDWLDLYVIFKVSVECNGFNEFLSCQGTGTYQNLHADFFLNLRNN